MIHRLTFSVVFAALVVCGLASGCTDMPNQGPRTASYALAAPGETQMGRLVQSRRVAARTHNDSGFRLLDTADGAFAARVALAEAAQSTLDLQYYAIHADGSTEVLLETVRRAARRGVRVRILLDDFNTTGANAQVLRLAFEPGVEMRLFNPLAGSRASLAGRIFTSLYDVERIQKRMHNKLFIADDTWGIAGGRNLGDAYFGAGEASNFVDMDVLAAGRVVQDMSASFDRYWNDPLAYQVQTLLSKEDIEHLRKKPAEQARSSDAPPMAAVAPAGSPGNAMVLPAVTEAEFASAERSPTDLNGVSLAWAPSLLLVDAPGKIGPGDDEADAGETVVDGLLGLMQKASGDVLIVSPYFVPGAPMMKVFADLRARGVKVRVLTNSLASNDAPAAHAGYRRYRHALLAMGVELHEMRSAGRSNSGDRRRGIRPWLGSGIGGSAGGASLASLHSKMVIIDRKLSAIGSMNLDLRSERKNSEVALLIRSPALAAEATMLIEGTFVHNAYTLEQDAHGTLLWRAPPGATYGDETSEPAASMMLKLLVDALSPFAPDAML
ncbi:phospholipase D family protein [Ramlibacter ginsenosidimutans]|nr:phospholipase D family protein [Ramlibacter ginsenosidimutans]